MGYKTFVSMNIAVIGASKTAETYATRYALAGHEVFIAWKDGDDTLISPALLSISNIHLCSIEDAAQIADLIIIASLPKDVREVSYWLGDVRKKVIIDTTANFYTEDVPVQTSCAIKAITGCENIVKVFSTRGFEQLLQPLFKDEDVRLLLVGSNKKSKEVAKILSRDLGVNLFFDLGGDEAIPLFNAMTSVWHNTLRQSVSSKKKLLVSKHKR